MNYSNKTGQEIFNGLLDQGFDRQQIADYACDGAALFTDGITDQEIVEELYEIAKTVKLVSAYENVKQLVAAVNSTMSADTLAKMQARDAESLQKIADWYPGN